LGLSDDDTEVLGGDFVLGEDASIAGEDGELGATSVDDEEMKDPTTTNGLAWVDLVGTYWNPGRPWEILVTSPMSSSPRLPLRLR